MTTESTIKEQPTSRPEVLAKQEQRLKEILDPTINPPLLLVIDMQQDFIGDGGKFKAMWHKDIAPMQAIIPRVTKLAEEAERRGIPVVYTKIYEDGAPRNVAGKDRLLFFENVLEQDDEDFEIACQKGTSGADLAIPTVAGAKIIEKINSSAFTPELRSIIEDNGIKTVIVTGVKTNRCVRLTIEDLYQNSSVHVVTPKDCIADDELSQHDAAIKELGTFYPPVVDLERIMQAWSEVRST